MQYIKCRYMVWYFVLNFNRDVQRKDTFNLGTRVALRNDLQNTHVQVIIGNTAISDRINLSIKLTIKRKGLICILGDFHRENLMCVDVTRRGGGYYQLATRARATCTSRWYTATPCNPHIQTGYFTSAVNSQRMLRVFKK